METTAADVLVVGAGPAGCALALPLAREGRDVLLVERFPAGGKDKLCGGVLTGEGQRLMAKVYSRDALDQLDAATIDTMRVLYRDYETLLPMSFRALPRARLDAFFLDQTQLSEAHIRERTSFVSVDEKARLATCRDLATGKSFQVEYDTLVAADGANSTVRRMVTGQRPRTAVSFVANTESPAAASTLVQRVYPSVAGGCWLIPQGDAATIGCLFFPEASHEPVGDMHQRVRDFAAELGCTLTSPLRGAPVPAGSDILLQSPGGTYFAGDAAGLAEPALGAGIHLALKSALALKDALTGGTPYARAMEATAVQLQEASENVLWASLRLGYSALKANDWEPGSGPVS